MEIAIVLYERFTALNAIGPYEVFNTLPDTKVTFVGLEKGPVATDSGSLSMVVEKTLAEVPNPEAFLLPGGLEGTFKVMKNPTMLQWIHEAHAKSRYTLSVCTGSLVLAAAGVLKGKKATTHWLCTDYLNKFGAQYQKDRVVWDDRVVTAAGVSAGIDMGLQLAETLAGEKAAQRVQLILEYDPQPPHDAGSPQKAPRDVVEQARKIMNAAKL